MKLTFRRIFVVAASSLGLAAAPMTPAQAATFPILYANTNAFAHSCQAFGDDGNYEGVLCADINVNSVSGSEYIAQGQVEAYCQKGSAVVSCENVDIRAGLYHAGNTGSSIPSHWCGSGAKACAGNGQCNYIPLNSFSFTNTLSNCATDGNGPTAIWTVVYYGSSVQLPDGSPAVMTSANDGENLSTGHYFACP